MSSKGYVIIRLCHHKSKLSKGCAIKRLWHQKAMSSKGYAIERLYNQKAMPSKGWAIKRLGYQKAITKNLSLTLSLQFQSIILQPNKSKQPYYWVGVFFDDERLGSFSNRSRDLEFQFQERNGSDWCYNYFHQVCQADWHLMILRSFSSKSLPTSSFDSFVWSQSCLSICF